jgi:hypothetical protein
VLYVVTSNYFVVHYLMLPQILINSVYGFHVHCVILGILSALAGSQMSTTSATLRAWGVDNAWVWALAWEVTSPQTYPRGLRSQQKTLILRFVLAATHSLVVGNGVHGGAQRI